jgi:hypothetical protein
MVAVKLSHSKTEVSIGTTGALPEKLAGSKSLKAES